MSPLSIEQHLFTQGWFTGFYLTINSENQFRHHIRVMPGIKHMGLISSHEAIAVATEIEWPV
jgi:hypothetical protein